MKKRTLHRILLAVALLTAIAACTDDLFVDPNGRVATGDGDDGMTFSMSVTEQADLIYEYGRTRAADAPVDSDLVRANTFGVHPFDGDAFGLSVHRMVLPLVGIHTGTVRQAPATTSGATRASVDDIVQSGDPLSFHDSITIWGFTDRGRPLFSSTILKKIRGWRSSVHWPYDLEGDKKDYLNPTKMKFYAVAPAMESLEDLKLETPPACNPATSSFTPPTSSFTPPTFSFTVPENPAEQRDLLFGQSAEVPISTGASGQGYNQYWDGNAPTDEWSREGHLGEDDKIVDLNFQHILTAVRFAQGKMPEGVTIKSIQLYHIKDQGTYAPKTGQWNVPDDVPSTSYTIETDHEVETWNAENTYIDNNQVLFLMPHTLTDKAQLIVTLQKDGETYTRTIKTPEGAMKGDEWKPGYTVTYKITIGELADEYYLLIEPDSKYKTSDPDPDPDNNTKYRRGEKTIEHDTQNDYEGKFIIHSYRNFKDISNSDDNAATAQVDNKHHRVGWQVTGFSPDGAEPYEAKNYPFWNLSINNDVSYGWLKSITGWKNFTQGTSAGEPDPQMPNNSTGDNQEVVYTIGKQVWLHQANHQKTLFENKEANDIDLSTHTPNGTAGTGDAIAKTTANCYIVNAQGTYRFPLVYGNAIEDGYTKLYSEGSPLLNPDGLCVDHRGMPIKEAYIWKQLKAYEKIDEVWSEWNKDNNYTETVTSTDDGVVTTEEKHGYYLKKITTESYNLSSADLTAEVVWQDVQGLVSACEVRGTGEDSYITFTIDGNKITPGNAVISLKVRKRKQTVTEKYRSDKTTAIPNTKTDDIDTAPTTPPETAWSWHIWVTDEVYPNNHAYTESGSTKSPVDSIYLTYHTSATYPDGSKIVELENYDVTKYKLLPANLGWVPEKMDWGVYEPREVWVEIAQIRPDKETPTNNNKIHLKLRQEAYQDLLVGSSTLYQWGRPTALPAFKNTQGETRTIYSGTGASTLTPTIRNFTAMQDAILYPEYFLRYKTGEWTDGDGKDEDAVDNAFLYQTWWNSNVSENDRQFWDESTKTLYDPSPAGFWVPGAGVLKGLSLTGETVDDGTFGSSSYGEAQQGLNIWRKNKNESNVDVTSAELKYGGYFYWKSHPIELLNTGKRKKQIPTEDRYGKMFYLPATARWSTNQSPGSSPVWTAPSKGIYWTSGKLKWNSEGYNGKMLWVNPNYETKKRHIVFDMPLGLGNAQPIRPRGAEITTP